MPVAAERIVQIVRNDEQHIRVHKIKGFVYGKVCFVNDRFDVDIRLRKGSRPICSGCGQPGPGYDTLDERHFHFVPLLSTLNTYKRRA